jgi:hypothetical protein
VTIRFAIKGKRWRVTLLTDRSFFKHDQTALALCELPPDRRILLKKSQINLQNIMHEVFHAFKSECCLNSAELDSSQVEELMCDIFAEHGEEALELSRWILKEITKQ